MEIFRDYKKYFILAGIIVLIGCIIYFYLIKGDDEIFLESDIEMVSTTSSLGDQIYVDIKGEVKKAGVYLVDSDARVIDVIKMAGGLTKNAVTTNINLSKKVTDEMVIYIFSKSDFKITKVKTTTSQAKCNCEVIEVNNCTLDEKQEDDGKVNINSASIDDLMTLSGIGEAKAKAIIDYRDKNGDFKVIEDIKNVSGFGDSLFEKIKDSITV